MLSLIMPQPATRLQPLHLLLTAWEHALTSQRLLHGLETFSSCTAKGHSSWRLADPLGLVASQLWQWEFSLRWLAPLTALAAIAHSCNPGLGASARLIAVLPCCQSQNPVRWHGVHCLLDSY